MSLTIDSILNFNSCEVENGFFEPPVSNPNGVNLHNNLFAEVGYYHGVLNSNGVNLHAPSCRRLIDQEHFKLQRRNLNFTVPAVRP